MNVSLRPELENFIKEQVKAGRYDTMDEAVNAAVARAKAEHELLSGELDEEDLTAIEEGLAQLNRGETRPWEEVKSELKAKLGSR
jgi:putative addiction module CopG family antidote